MMEQAQAGHGHGDVVFIARFDDIVIADGAAGLGDVVDTAAMSRSMLSPKGKKASLPKATPWSWAIQAFFSSRVSGSGFSVNRSSRCRRPGRLRNHRRCRRR